MIEEKLKKFGEHKHKYIHAERAREREEDTHTHTHTTVAVVSSSTTTKRVPTAAKQTNRGGPGPREMIEPSRLQGGETSNNLQDKKIKREEEEEMGGREGQAGGHSSCLAYETLH